MMTANGLAKLIEECGELIQVAGKKLACPDSDEHWDGAGLLSTRLEDEIADVMAACQFVIETHMLDGRHKISERKTRKLMLFREWHAQQNDAPKGQP